MFKPCTSLTSQPCPLWHCDVKTQDLLRSLFFASKPFFLRFGSMEMTTRLQRFQEFQIPFGTFQISGMADVVACIASSKPSLEQEKVQAVLIRCRVMCWTSCSRCVALPIWIYGDKQRGVSICMWALWCRVCQCHHSFSAWPAWMTCLQGSLAHRYTDSSLVEPNLTDIFFSRRLVANVSTCLPVARH